MAYGYPNYSYTPYSYNPPMPDQLAQLRGQPYPQQPAQNAPGLRRTRKAAAT